MNKVTPFTPLASIDTISKINKTVDRVTNGLAVKNRNSSVDRVNRTDQLTRPRPQMYGVSEQVVEVK